VTDLFLGLIALAVLVMAIIQVAAIVFAARAARHVGDAVSRLEERVQPIIASLQMVAADAARASAAASAQVEKAGRLVDDLVERVDQTIVTAQDTILRPAREGLAFLAALRKIFGGPSRGRRSTTPRQPPVDDENALFIG
jgi:hypothetical protein